jgi:hypothetical protein
MTEPFVAPDLQALAGTLLTGNAQFVVIGGFAVIANRYVRGTEDIDLLIPEDTANDQAIELALEGLDARWFNDDRPLLHGELTGRDHSRLRTPHGMLDLLREGSPPLDFATVREGAVEANLGAGPFHVAGLASLVAFKRLAGRPQDRADLAELEAIHGPLPIQPVPGLDP